jgi:hypothetical protein
VTTTTVNLTIEQADELEAILNEELANLHTQVADEGDVEHRRRLRKSIRLVSAMLAQLEADDVVEADEDEDDNVDQIIAEANLNDRKAAK